MKEWPIVLATVFGNDDENTSNKWANGEQRRCKGKKKSEKNAKIVCDIILFCPDDDVDDDYDNG